MLPSVFDYQVILTRSLSHDRFAAWALLLQFAAYVNLLDFGLQTAVSRFVALSLEQGAVEERNRIISTAFALLSVSALAAYVAMYIVVPLLAAIFRDVSPDLLAELKKGSASSGLLFYAPHVTEST